MTKGGNRLGKAKAKAKAKACLLANFRTLSALPSSNVHHLLSIQLHGVYAVEKRSMYISMELKLVYVCMCVNGLVR